MHRRFVTDSPNLLTIPVDDKCNKAYQRVEDYFVTALMPRSRGSYAWDAIYKKALERYRGGEKSGRLALGALRAFE